MQESRDGAWRGDLADQIDVTDVDAQFQRCSGNQHLQVAPLEALFGVQSMFFRHAPVVRGDGMFAQALTQVPGHALGHAPGVDENQRGPMLAGQLCQPVIHQLPDIVGHDRAQWHGWHLDP